MDAKVTLSFSLTRKTLLKVYFPKCLDIDFTACFAILSLIIALDFSESIDFDKHFHLLSIKV